MCYKLVFMPRVQIKLILESLLQFDRLFNKRLSFLAVCQVCYYTDE